VTKSAAEVPNKLFYKIGEVCEITDTQPYVLRFWESEFPQLAPRKNRSGQRVYQRRDIDTVLRIKRLLYEEEYTIAGARRKLDDDPAGEAALASRAPQAPEVTEGPEGPQGNEAESAAVLPLRRQGVEPDESDHPVDLLAARIESRVRHDKHARRTQPADPDREARLDAAMAELKKQLREILGLLSQ